MRNKWLYMFLAASIIVSIIFPSGVHHVNAQPPQPPEQLNEPKQIKACIDGEPCVDLDGNWFLPNGSNATNNNSELSAIGDTDEFGYTLSNTTYSWSDATNGTNTGLTQDWDQVMVSLPFTFKFYENSYTSVYIAGPGYLTFSDQNIGNQNGIPDSAEPNNIIAPFWAPWNYTGEGGTGQTFYKLGGTSPNRYLLVEYYRMSDNWGGIFTFEVQLFENGDIKFQYDTMNGGSSSRWCTDEGIEDSTGADGLTLSSYFCDVPPTSKSAVLFTRPSTTARVRALPLYQGGFTFPGEVDEYTFIVSNTGEMGADTYDMAHTLIPGDTSWTIGLFNASTMLPLTDTDGDAQVDTGVIAQGGSFEVLARLTAPNTSLAVGSGMKALIDITSSLNISKSKTVTLESTVPTAFTQVYRDRSTYKVNNDINWPSTQLKAEVTPNDQYNADNPAVLETPAHNFFTLWNYYDWKENDSNGYILRYSVVDRFGQVIQPATNLTSLPSESSMYIREGYFSVAVTPDGKIGVIWSRYINNNSTDLWNQNIYFAVLNETGGLVSGPVNLTNNNQWGNDAQGGYTYYRGPKLEASSDNRFLLAWDTGYYQDTSNNEDSDIYYMVRSSNGSALTTLINMTADVENSNWISDISLTTLTDNRFYVYYARCARIDSDSCNYYRKYRVINSSGSQVIGESDPNHGSVYDSIQLPNGNIFLGTTAWNSSTGNDEAGYVVISGTNFTKIASGSLSHSSMDDVFASSISVTKSPDGKAIMTWMDSNQRYLYYALIHPGGTVVSGPVIFKYFENEGATSYQGYGITTNSWQPNVGMDAMAEFSGPSFGAAPGSAAGIWVRYGNQGLTTATNNQLTLTLAAGLTYSYDTSGITPVLGPGTVTWALPDLAFAEKSEFAVYVTLPSDAVIGTLYDVGLAITSGGSDVDLSNNSDTAQVMASKMLYLPIIMK